MRKGIFPELGRAQRYHGLGKENTFCRKESGFQVVMQNHSFFLGSQNSMAVKKDTFSENTACEKGCFHRNSEHTV